MGSFFTNLQIRKASTRAVCDALPDLTDSRAYVSPEKNGWVTVYPEVTEDQNDETLRAIAGGLSEALKTHVLAFLVHDSDIAAYWLFHKGALTDEFNSAPDYFDEDVDDETRARLSGNTGLLLPLCNRGTTHAQLDAVLHPLDSHPVFAEEIVSELANLLGIEDSRACLGFNYFDNEGADTLPDVADFVPIGSGTERKNAKPRNDSHEPVVEPPDAFSFAIAMLTQVWNPEHEQSSVEARKMFGHSADEVIKKIRDTFDRSARDLLKKSKVAGLPTLDEFKTARDKGPDALAALIADKTPGQLTEIGVDAANNGYEAFVSALLKRGLDPSAAAANGRTTLTAAEEHGTSSSIYRLVKAAADERK